MTDVPDDGDRSPEARRAGAEEHGGRQPDAGRAAGPPPTGLRRHLPRPAPRPGLGAVVAALLAVAAVAALLAAFTGVGPALFDVAVLGESIEVRSGALTVLAVAVTNIGSTGSMAVLAVAVAIWCWYHGRIADAVFVVGAMAGAAIAFRVLKMLFDRPRPPAGGRLVMETNQSLPSGHATMSIVVIGTLVVLAWAGRSVAARVVMAIVAVAWVAAVGITRIYLGVHWLSDVIAGWLVGAAWLAMCVALWSWWLMRHKDLRAPPPRTVRRRPAA